MRIIKLIIIALILGLTGIIYAAGDQQTPPDGKDKAASCCAKCGDSCSMKAKDKAPAHKSSDMDKDGKSCCAADKPDCCKDGAECCKTGADCCKADGASCCAHHQMSKDKQAKTQACDMKDGQGCCGADCACCKGGSCSKEKTAKQ